MTKRIDLFYNTYSKFSEQVLKDIRKETFGEDIGQNSWLTVNEFNKFISWLALSEEHHVLEVSSGSGGPALYLADKIKCRVTGIDINDKGILAGKEMAMKADMRNKLNFIPADANTELPFSDNIFDGLVCIDSMNHYTDRQKVLNDWYRVLRPGKRAVFTDPVVITGPVTNDEIILRSSIGLFLFVPPKINEQLIKNAGFKLLKKKDVTENAALISERWYKARLRYKNVLIQMEGEENYEGLQNFFLTVFLLSSERRLSRIVYLAEKQ